MMPSVCGSLTNLHQGGQPKGHQVASRGHQVAPRGHQVASRGHQVAPKGHQVASRRHGLLAANDNQADAVLWGISKKQGASSLLQAVDEVGAVERVTTNANNSRLA
eukprot:140068-Chlamydomonas_euryale.AAC.3